ncbi:alcohol dehydrogenase [Zeugodacus cucurbitae]|uniref:alcohol dehydrogenase n=1 Tax=Zeugodacus cucurbitae TaxID=28588 RepID=UPI0023D9592B|nr:alcohol dehydrogenase [Zeugodacus cucurbitae]
MDVKGKNVIYSGGFGGIGLACVREFLKHGAKYVTIFDLEENDEAMLALRKSYPNATIDFIPVDMRKKASITMAFKSAVEKMEHFDVLVNGCAIMMDSQVELTIEINLLGLIHSTLAALPYMDKSSGGHGGVIVNISSVAGLETPGLFAIYTASKHGVTAFTRCMGDQIYYDRFGVSFITICPGLTETSLTKDLHSRVTFQFNEEVAKIFLHSKQQSAELCAENMIKVIEIGKNGGVYLLDLGNIQEITYPQLWEPTFEAH